MNDNQKFILAFSLLIITYINFFVTSHPIEMGKEINDHYQAQGNENEKNLDFAISPNPILPPNTPFEHNEHCSCDQDILVYYHNAPTCHCQTEKTCVCETCTCQANHCKNGIKKYQ